MGALVVTVLLASLLGSFHCAGMCGAFVAFAVGVGRDGTGGPSRTMLQGAYHGGRLATYVSLGAAAGLVGQALDLGGSMVGVQRIAAVLASGTMIGFGTVLLLRLRGVRVRRLRLPKPVERAIGHAHGWAAELSPLARAWSIGLLTTLLPCGWLWAFVATSAGTADPATGAVVMGAFWLGTLPLLAAVGAGVQAISGPLARRLPGAMAMAIIVVGIVTIGRRLEMPVHAMPSAVQGEMSVEESIERIRSLDSVDLGCGNVDR